MAMIMVTFIKVETLYWKKPEFTLIMSQSSEPQSRHANVWNTKNLAIDAYFKSQFPKWLETVFIVPISLSLASRKRQRSTSDTYVRQHNDSRVMAAMDEPIISLRRRHREDSGCRDVAYVTDGHIEVTRNCTCKVCVIYFKSFDMLQSDEMIEFFSDQYSQILRRL